MFFLVALFFVSLVVSVIFTPKPKISNATPGKLSDVNFPRANEGDPVPRIYGTLKFKAPNTIWSGNFKSVAIKKKVKTGLFSSKKQTIGYKYYIGMDLAVCLGPNFTFRRLWAGNYELWNGCLTECENVIKINLPNLFGGQDKAGGWTGFVALYCGSYDQNQDSYLQKAIYPNNEGQVPAYNGIAHMVLRGCYIGNTTSMQPIYIEGSCFPDSLGLNGRHIMSNGLDMNPIAVLHHIFTDDWGNLGIDPAKINVEQWREFALTVFNERNGMSLEVTNAAQAGDAVKEILAQVAATLYQNPATGLYDLIGLRNDYDIDLLPVLGPDEISVVSDFNKILWSQTYNTVRVKYTDRNQKYLPDVTALAQDFANIRYQNKVLPQEITMQGVYEPEVGNMIAARELSNINVPLYSTKLTLNRMGSALPPGAAFVFVWPEYGIERMVMRVRKLGLGTLENGEVSMDVVQDVFSVAEVIMSPPGTSPYIPPDTSPKPITTFDVFSLPYWLDYNSQLGTMAGEQSIGLFAVAPSPYSTAFNAYIVGTEDAEVLSQAPYADTAKLVAPLDKYEGFVEGVVPTLNIVSVTNPELLLNGSGRAANGLFMLNDEIMSFDTFVDNEDGTYTLQNVYRALFDTVYTAATVDDVLYFFEGQEAFLDDSFAVGEAFGLKLADISSSSQDDNPAVINVVPVDRLAAPLPPDNLALDGVRAADASSIVGASLSLSWAARNRLTAGSAVVLETDAADDPEPGTTYRLDVVSEVTGDVIATQDDIAASPVDVVITLAMQGPLRLEVRAKVGTKVSFNPAIYPLQIFGSLTIDANRVTIDGNGILM
jgi:hypothetical protein